MKMWAVEAYDMQQNQI